MSIEKCQMYFNSKLWNALLRHIMCFHVIGLRVDKSIVRMCYSCVKILWMGIWKAILFDVSSCLTCTQPLSNRVLLLCNNPCILMILMMVIRAKLLYTFYVIDVQWYRWLSLKTRWLFIVFDLIIISSLLFLNYIKYYYYNVIIYSQKVSHSWKAKKK